MFRDGQRTAWVLMSHCRLQQDGANRQGWQCEHHTINSAKTQPSHIVTLREGEENLSELWSLPDEVSACSHLQMACLCKQKGRSQLKLVMRLYFWISGNPLAKAPDKL